MSGINENMKNRIRSVADKTLFIKEQTENVKIEHDTLIRELIESDGITNINFNDGFYFEHYMFNSLEVTDGDWEVIGEPIDFGFPVGYGIEMLDLESIHEVLMILVEGDYELLTD